MKKVFRFFLKSVLWFIAFSVFSVILFRFVPIPVTPLMIIRSSQQIFSGRELMLEKDWQPLEKISAAMPLAVISAEDQRFEEHYGFDFEAIEKARKHNMKNKGKKIKGASTISQQTAKNVFLWPARSWVRKGFEVYFTFLIEIFWSKKRIMEVYLNVIETGDGVYGVEAASQRYFNKPASKLTNREAALIAAVLPNPRKWSPAKPTPYIQKKAGRIMYFMARMKPLSF
ncbi:MAG: monofunctional biosynthetic peptidoglycan transglycosylase [Bacteroidetes bacterium]|nr:MAG: monofunctional biosynthetic peptidoglycan transglycosylase [Bacteroidota bacterium]